MSARSLPPFVPLDPDYYELDVAITTPLRSPEPSEYATAVSARIVFDDWPPDPRAGMARRVPAGRLSLTVYDLARAEHDGQNPMEVFDCLSQDALETYRLLYDGYEVRVPPLGLARPDAAWQDVTSPSLVVVESVEVLPRHRGRGLGLVAVLKALHLFGPPGGLAALWAAPINYAGGNAIPPSDPLAASWGRRMKPSAFDPDPARACRTLARYWRRLGFAPVADLPPDSALCARPLSTPLPDMADVLSSLGLLPPDAE
jgi:hypothetical protein